jgi:two-component system CitB family sensor kinase
MVAVGILSVDVAGEVARQLAVLGAGALVAVALGVGLAVVAARRVRRDTLGLDPREITALHGHHEAVLHAMREGLLVVEDATGRVAVLNDEAARLLGVTAAAVPAIRGDRHRSEPTLAGLGVDPQLRERLDDPGPVTDETHLVGERILLVNRTRVVTGGTASSVVTLRDRTEVDTTLRALDDARSLAGALRFQAHEHANRLQAVATLVELGAHDDARDLAVRWGRDVAGVGDEIGARIADPALAALLVDKATDARDRGLEMRLGPGTELSAGDDPSVSSDLVTVVGNLVDNALDAAVEGAGRGVVEVAVTGDGEAVTVRVGDDGPGLPDADAVFTAGWSTKSADGTDGTDDAGRRRGLGLALVRRVAERRGGTVVAGPGIDGAGTTFTVTLRVM